ncbi:MAG TPA: hypothetical protein VJ826_14945 [Candidatus Polarisedimenticolaceae bacterium]|nr:hypothetical protein [Candidatus Polarisedimenticolaceae bacterium]
MAERKPFLLRIPPELWDELNRWAGEELRSVNGQIEWILRRAVEERTGKPKPRRPGAPPQTR